MIIDTINFIRKNKLKYLGKIFGFNELKLQAGIKIVLYIH